ncbi:MAG: hypothetical protein OXU74_17125 [Gemmatimonadota bacterium]|nr:hypothetical protein [Gemmatimonadota bacterium]
MDPRSNNLLNGRRAKEHDGAGNEGSQLQRAGEGAQGRDHAAGTGKHVPRRGDIQALKESLPGHSTIREALREIREKEMAEKQRSGKEQDELHAKYDVPSKAPGFEGRYAEGAGEGATASGSEEEREE